VLPVEVFRSTLTKLVGVLRGIGIRFHLTGGITAVAYGEPRLTQDLDVVIDAEATIRNRDKLIAALVEAGFYLEEQTARAAIDGRRMFQILDVDEALKLDLYPERSIPGELDRSVTAEVLPGLALPIAARTDAALSKVIWAAKGSHKSRTDVRRILERATTDETATVRRMAAERNLLQLLDEILSEPDLD
jgi:hypothetical protein